MVKRIFVLALVVVLAAYKLSQNETLVPKTSVPGTSLKLSAVSNKKVSPSDERKPASVPDELSHSKSIQFYSKAGTILSLRPAAGATDKASRAYDFEFQQPAPELSRLSLHLLLEKGVERVILANKLVAIVDHPENTKSYLTKAFPEIAFQFREPASGLLIVNTSAIPLSTLQKIKTAVDRVGVVRAIDFDSLIEPSALPNDPLTSQQWALENRGMKTFVDVDIDYSLAYSRFGADCSGVKVMVIDSGIAADHPDLATNISQTRINALYKQDVSPIYDGSPKDVMDYNGHGTHVAGIIGAVGNNGVGISGICGRVEIVPVRAGTSIGAILTSAVSIGILQAKSLGVRVINLSLGGPVRDSAMESAIAQASQDGLVIVAAAGNSGQDNSSVDTYPANFSAQNPNVISVAALAPNQKLADFSNYGANVDIAAPGQSILSTFPTTCEGICRTQFPNGPTNYGVLSGTSMAAPVVTGSIALAIALEPSVEVSTLKARLQKTGELISDSGKAIADNRTLNLHRFLAHAVPTCSTSVRASYSHEEFVQDLYCRILKRPADAGGFQHWVATLNSGFSRRDVALAFIGSQEFANLGANQTAEEFYSEAYLSFLGRKPEVGAPEYWSQQAQADSVRAILLSGEAQNRMSGYGIW